MLSTQQKTTTESDVFINQEKENELFILRYLTNLLTLRNLTLKLSDEEIVLLLRSRDTKGIDILYEKYGSYIYGSILQIVKNDYFSETVLQNTFLKIWNNIDSFSFAKGRLFTWSLNIAKNASIDMIRSRQYRESLKLTCIDQISKTAISLDNTIKLDRVDLKDIVARMDLKYSRLIDLIYFQGYTQMEIAQELNMPLGTVKSRIRKAFKDLKCILEE